MEAGTEGTRRSQRRELQRGTAVKSTTKLAPSHTVIPSFKAIIQKTRFWPTKPDCGPPLPLGVLPPRGGAHREGGGRRAAPRPALSAGRKKKQKRGGATPSRVLFVARRHQIDEVPGLVFVLPVSDARVSACKHARAPPTRLPPRPRTEWRLRLRLTSFPPAPQRGTGSLLPPSQRQRTRLDVQQSARDIRRRVGSARGAEGQR